MMSQGYCKGLECVTKMEQKDVCVYRAVIIFYN